MKRITALFHFLVTTLIIIHISVCSEFFGGTQIWAYLTYLCEACFLVVFLQFLMKICRLNRLEMLGLLYFIFLLVISLLYSIPTKNVVALIGRTIEIATILMIIDLNKNDLRPYLFAGSLAFSLCVYINFFLLLANPLGMMGEDGKPFYFLGTNYNQIGPKVIFGYLFNIFLLKHYKLFSILNIVAVSVTGLISLLIVGSMTSTVSFCFLILITFNSYSHRLNDLVSKGLLLFVVFFQIFVVMLGGTLSVNVVSDFLDFIGKDATFTGRTILWDYSASYFLDSPIWGHGYITAAQYAESDFFHGITKTAHNFVYYTLHKGGLILLILIFQMIRISYNKMKLRINEIHAHILYIVTLVLFLMQLFEHYDMIYLFMLMSFMYYYNYFVGYVKSKSINIKRR